jgi:hypothetical protein
MQVMFDCHGDQVYDVALKYCMKTMEIREVSTGSEPGKLQETSKKLHFHGA